MNNLKLKCYMFYYENRDGKECQKSINSATLNEAKEIFVDSFKDEIIKISEFPRLGEGSIPNVVYHRDTDG